ncbi:MULTISPECIES: DUF697 domain-containing protein [Priestia]|uniref:DUF697 domain-containing protein n=1 Tax=Priestia aryabhattai TaxID=412384 RepID=A0ABD7X389_PRIAR|nr:DUF697 domain-containing protein [Priestia aryabhattai]WEA46787.1 DUF697 domain-containing protein [Priestia aryabhattai]
MITSLSELERVKKEAKKMVKKRASLSSVAAAIPLPGVDISADVAIMFELINSINKKFGLTPEQIDELDLETQRILIVIITSLGSELAGKVITKQLVAQLLKKVGAKVATKSIAKFVPIVGQAAAAGISFASMKYLGDSHIEECYAISKKFINNRNAKEKVNI